MNEQDLITLWKLIKLDLICIGILVISVFLDHRSKDENVWQYGIFFGLLFSLTITIVITIALLWNYVL